MRDIQGSALAIVVERLKPFAGLHGTLLIQWFNVQTPPLLLPPTKKKRFVDLQFASFIMGLFSFCWCSLVCFYLLKKVASEKHHGVSRQTDFTFRYFQDQNTVSVTLSVFSILFPPPIQHHKHNHQLLIHAIDS